MASLNSTDNVAGALINLGADAMSNMYDVDITLPSAVSTAASVGNTTMRFRTKGFKIPESSAKLYDFSYKTVTIKKVATSIEFERTFDISFIVDADYAVYKHLKKWAALTSKASTGEVNEILSSVGDLKNKGTVKIIASGTKITNDTQSNQIKSSEFESATSINLTSPSNLTWTFDNVVCYKVTEPDFAQGEATALEVTASFFFGNMTDPQNSL